jgi:hypothetical protein
MIKINKIEIYLFIFIFFCFQMILGPFENLRYIFSLIIFAYTFRIVTLYPSVLDSFRFLLRNKYFTFYTLIFIISLIRTNNPDNDMTIQVFRISMLVIFIFLVNSFVYSYIMKSGEDKLFNLRLIRNLLLPFFLFGLINLLFYFAGIKSESLFVKGYSVTLKSIGITLERVKFYFVSGINSYGTLLGGLLSMSLTYYFFVQKNMIYLIFSLTFIILLLFTDTRGAFLFSFISFLFIFLFSKKWISIKWIKFIPVLYFIGPIILFFLLLNFGADSGLVREDEDVTSGNSRFLIWGIIFQELSVFKFEHIFGFGEYGVSNSNIISPLTKLFNSNEIKLIHPHNSILVSIIDTGYIGLASFLILIFNVFNNIVKMWHRFKCFQIVMLSVLIYIVLIGQTETAFGFYYQNFIFLFYSILILQANLSKISDYN